MLDVLWCFGETPASLTLSSVLIDPRGFAGKSFDSVSSLAFSGLLLDSVLKRTLNEAAVATRGCLLFVFYSPPITLMESSGI